MSPVPAAPEGAGAGTGPSSGLSREPTGDPTGEPTGEPISGLTRDEARHRADTVAVDSYDVHLDLSGAPDGGTFGSRSVIRFRALRTGVETFVDLIAARVAEVVLDGTLLDPAACVHGSRILLPALAEGVHELAVSADCAYTNSGEGLHRFVDPADGEVYLYTQFEVADARRVFAAFDQPDLKAAFRFTVRAPRGWRVVSNSPTPEPADGLWAFEATARISTYVTAIVAGPYHAVRDEYRGGGRVIPLAVYCRASLAEYLDAPRLFELNRMALDWFQEKFDQAYPFEKYDLLFVPEFNSGAMENAGAVTVHDRYVFRGEATGAEHETLARGLIHELAHMWFGDLVTLRWWDDLWLNESFATYASIACQSAAPGSGWPDAWTTFADATMAWACRADQMPSAHPVVAEVRDLAAVLLNFDGITYAKGAALLKQLVAVVGEDAFFGGVRRYLRRHAFGNAALPDLLAALEEESGRKLTPWATAWLRTAGINVLRTELGTDEAGVITSFTIRQEVAASPSGPVGEPILRTHRLAVGLYGDDGAGKGRLRRLAGGRIEVDVEGAVTEVPALVGLRRPDVLLVNDDDLAYAKIRLDERSLATVLDRLGDFEASLPRALAWSIAWDMTRDGELATRDYLRTVLRAIGDESDAGLLQSAIDHVGYALDHYADPGWRAEGLEVWGQAAEIRMRAADGAAGAGAQVAWARAFFAAARTPGQLDLLARLLDGSETIAGLDMGGELRWPALRRCVAAGRAGEGEIAAELRRDPTAAGRWQAAAARAAMPEPDAKEAAWRLLTGAEHPANAMVEAVADGFAQADQLDLLAPYTRRYFAELDGLYAARGHEIGRRLVTGLFPSLRISPDTVAATDAWLAAGRRDPTLRRMVLEARDDLLRALRARQAYRTSRPASGGEPAEDG